MANTVELFRDKMIDALGDMISSLLKMTGYQIDNDVPLDVKLSGVSFENNEREKLVTEVLPFLSMFILSDAALVPRIRFLFFSSHKFFGLDEKLFRSFVHAAALSLNNQVDPALIERIIKKVDLYRNDTTEFKIFMLLLLALKHKEYLEAVILANVVRASLEVESLSESLGV